MIRISFFTLGAWSVKAFRAGCLVLLGATVVRSLGDLEHAYVSGYVILAGVCYIAAWVMGLVLKGHIEKRRSSRGGWRFWVCLGDRWFEIDAATSTNSEVALFGAQTDKLSYVNEFFEVLMYGLSRLSWGTLVLETRHCPLLFLERAKQTKKGRVTTYILGSREEPKIEFVEAWNDDGRRIQLRVSEVHFTSFRHMTGEQYTLRIEDAGETPLIYRPRTLMARVEALSKTEARQQDGPGSPDSL